MIDRLIRKITYLDPMAKFYSDIGVIALHCELCGRDFHLSRWQCRMECLYCKSSQVRERHGQGQEDQEDQEPTVPNV